MKLKIFDFVDIFKKSFKKNGRNKVSHGKGAKFILMVSISFLWNHKKKNKKKNKKDVQRFIVC